MKPKVGDLIKFITEDENEKLIYAYVHRITDNEQSFWGYWCETKEEAKRKYDEIKNTGEVSHMNYQNLDFDEEDCYEILETKITDWSRVI